MRWREPDFRGRRMLTKTLLVQCLLEGSLNRSPERARSAESRPTSGAPCSRGWNKCGQGVLLSAFAQSLANDASARESWTALSAAGLQPRRGSGWIARGLRDRGWSDPVG